MEGGERVRRMGVEGGEGEGEGGGEERWGGRGGVGATTHTTKYYIGQDLYI